MHLNIIYKQMSEKKKSVGQNEGLLDEGNMEPATGDLYSKYSKQF